MTGAGVGGGGEKGRKQIGLSGGIKGIHFLLSALGLQQ